MGLHEFGWGGVYISPLFIYALLALGLLLFDCALFVLILCAITWALSGTP